MGTNYYFYDKPPCETCERPYEPMHIGKSSLGWRFSLHVLPDEGITSLADWITRWSLQGSYILNEYGDKIAPERLTTIITTRDSASKGQADSSVGDRFATRGPEGSSYDYCHGDFS